MKRLLALFSTILFCAPAAEKPNLVVFLVDDMGIMDSSVSFLPGTAANRPDSVFRTPNMERLAARGMTFTKAYAMPVCTPSRVCLMTGMNSARHRVTNWTSPQEGGETGQAREHPRLLSPREWRRTGYARDWTSLPASLRDAGYRTIHVGKAHFGNDGHSADPANIGFEVNIAGRSIGHPGSYSGNYGKGSTHEVRGLDAYHGTGTHLSDALTLEAIRAIDAAVADRKPFFAHLAHYAVHSPFQTDERFAKNHPGLKGPALAFATLIEGMDKSLGDLLDHLEKSGIAENTFIVFLSDNGSDSPLLSAPLRARKGSKYEGGVRIPMIAAWAKPSASSPLQTRLPVRPASRTDEMTAIFDLCPTLLGIAGAAIPERAAMDGIDLKPVLAGGRGSRDSLLIHFPHAHRSDFFTHLRLGDEKLIHNYADDSYELYDLARDPGEKKNLASAKPERVRQLARIMKTQLLEHRAQWPVKAEDGSDDPIADP